MTIPFEFLPEPCRAGRDKLLGARCNLGTAPVLTPTLAGKQSILVVEKTFPFNEAIEGNPV